MMIITVVGGSDNRRAEVIRQLMQSDITLIRHLSIEGLTQINQCGLSRLKAEFDCSNQMLMNVVTVVSGISTEAELVYLRSKKATVCHCYGELAALYESITCAKDDRFVLPEPFPLRVPDHIYSPNEVLSECYFKG